MAAEEGHGINLLPFQFMYWVKRRFKSYGLYGVLRPLGGLYLNILMFVPFGFLASTVKQEYTAWKIIFVGFIVSLLIELTQMATHLGMFETDDLMTNTIGAWLGTVIYQKRMRKI